MLKHLFTLSLITTQALALLAQIDPDQKISDWPTLQNSPNYYAVRQQYLEYLHDMEVTAELLGIEPESDDYEAKFMRWDYLMRTRVDANGNYPEPGILFRAFDAYKQAHQNYSAGSRDAMWEPVGLAMVPTDGGGVGRVNVIQYDPANPDIVYIGTAGGGL
ncbi:MAG: hypothetical protein R2794_08195 [Chitinophagales bacterium]